MDIMQAYKTIIAWCGEKNTNYLYIYIYIYTLASTHDIYISMPAGLVNWYLGQKKKKKKTERAELFEWGGKYCKIPVNKRSTRTVNGESRNCGAQSEWDCETAGPAGVVNDICERGGLISLSVAHELTKHVPRPTEFHLHALRGSVD